MNQATTVAVLYKVREFPQLLSIIPSELTSTSSLNHNIMEIDDPSSQQSHCISHRAHSQADSPVALEKEPLHHRQLNVYDSWDGFPPPDVSILKCLTGVRPAREYQEWAGFDDPPAAVRYQEWTGFNDPLAAGPARKYQAWTGFDSPPEGPRIQNVCLVPWSRIYFCTHLG